MAYSPYDPSDWPVSKIREKIREEEEAVTRVLHEGNYREASKRQARISVYIKAIKSKSPTKTPA